MSNMSNKKKQVIDFMSKFKRNLQAKNWHSGGVH